MSTQSSNNKRIAKNSIMLYFRMALLMVVSLYTSRVVLKALGVEDYGIYNVVGGIISMLGFLSGSLSGATSRFITYEIGKGNRDSIEKVFRCSITIYYIFGIIILLLAETVGLWFVNSKLVIPEARINAAMWVYQCSVITFIISVISIPYNALIIAYEKMSAFAYISIYEAVGKLLIALLIPFVAGDKLILYALLILALQMSTRFIYMWYSKKHFDVANPRWLWKKELSKKLLSYSGWTMNGNLAVVGYTQGISILLNMFFGPVVNAARAIAVQIQSAVTQFLTSFGTAIGPQIVKSYAQNDFSYMHSLVIRGTKFSFFLTLVLVVPLYVNIEYILQFWLSEVPEYTASFARLTLLAALSTSLSNVTLKALHATGRIKRFQIIEGTLLLMIVPIAYVCLRWFNINPSGVFVVYLAIEFITQFVRVWIIYPMIKLSIKKYLTDILFPIFKTFLIIIPISVLLYKELYSTTFYILVINVLICILLTLLSMFFLGLSSNERIFVISKIKEIVSKIK